MFRRIGKLIKIDVDSEKVFERLFATTCVEVVITKPLQMKVKYKWDNAIKFVAID